LSESAIGFKNHTNLMPAVRLVCTKKVAHFLTAFVFACTIGPGLGVIGVKAARVLSHVVTYVLLAIKYFVTICT
jgi:hypothetical protein